MLKVVVVLVVAALVSVVGAFVTLEQVMLGEGHESAIGALARDSDEDAVLKALTRIAATQSSEERAGLMVDFAHYAREVDRAVMERPAVLDALANLLNDDTQSVIVDAAYLLADIGPPASRILPKLKARLKRYPSSVSVPELGFEFNHDGKPDGAMEHAIAAIEGSSP